MQYKGKKIQLEDGTVQVDLYADDNVIETHIVENDNIANSYIIPWVAQEGYTRLDVTDANYTVDWDNFDSVYLYQQ